MNIPNNTGDNPARAWVIFALVVLAIVAVQLYSLRYSPTIWQDEIQIIDWGRTILPGGDQSYSMSWLAEGRPYAFLSYLGCAVQELACRLSADDPAGPRLSTLMGAVVAAAAMTGFLMQSGSRPWIAVCCGLLLLLSPTLAQGYRGARVDSWAIAFMLLACWAVGRGKEARGTRLEARGARGERHEALGGTGEGEQPAAADQKTKGPKDYRAESAQAVDFGKNHFGTLNDSLQAPAVRAPGWFALAGVMIGVAGLLWVSAIVLLPLVLCLLIPDKTRGWRLSDTFSSLAVCGVCALATVGLLFVPVWDHLPLMLHDFTNKSSRSLGLSDVFVRVPRLLHSLQLSPLVPALGLASLVLLRRWPLLLAFFAAVCFVVVTGTYTHRNVYLVPYFVVGLAGGADALAARGRKASSSAAVVLVVCLTWSAAVSLGGRSLAAFSGAAERDPAVVLRMATEKIGAGPHKVYVWNWEFGYAARKLGWKFYKSFGWESLTETGFLALLQEVDHVVVAADYPLAPSEAQMRQLGFTRSERAAPEVAAADNSFIPRVGTAKYGEYVFYSRPEVGKSGR